MTRDRVIQNIITFRHRYPHLHQLLLEDTKECGNQTCSRLISLTSRIATLCRSCLTISSSSFPVCRLTCLPSFVITSKESLCHPPKVSTTRGMNTIPSASHLSLYFPTLMLKATHLVANIYTFKRVYKQKVNGKEHHLEIL